MKVNVIDLSHHNVGPNRGRSPIDFAAIAASGIRGVILKASQGTRYVDPTYAERRAAAADAGLLVGAYHFATAEDVDAQVGHFLETAKPDEALLMALDHEPNPPARGGCLDLDDAQAFLESARDQLGRQLVLYTGNLLKEQMRGPIPFFNGHRLWLAHYNNHYRCPPGWDAPWLHQFSGDGVNAQGNVIPGIDPSQAGQIDMNAFYGAGGDDQLAAEWAA